MSAQNAPNAAPSRRSPCKLFFSFPKGGELRYEPEPGKGIENYEHLTKDRSRREYIHTLPRTLKNHDVVVEFTTEDGRAKAYIIKKYFDPDIQKDIWDLLVIHDATVKTKFINKVSPGKHDKSTETKILRAGDEASHISSTPGGAIATPPPHAGIQ